MAAPVLTYLLDAQAQQRKLLAVLIDPDKAHTAYLDQVLTYPADIWLVGGSLISSGDLDHTATWLKQHTNKPVVIFPGHATHITRQADALLFLSLISGRNADLLIGQHVISAPAIKAAGLEVLPTGYMLVDGGSLTTVNYMSQTLPIPANKPDIAACTAMAGEMLGLRLMYLDAGSGASHPVPTDMIAAVRRVITCPLIVGGGLRTPEAIEAAYDAGADMVVVGTALEKAGAF
jgi:putative glycerol-1-phosphate prenyltransferase